MKKIIKTTLLSATLLVGSLFGATLEDGNYTLKIFKVDSNGSVAADANATGNGMISDGSGKLKDINISGVPIDTECNFMATRLYKVDGNTTVDMNRSSIVPCPQKDGTVELGLNSLSTNQMTALQDLGKDIASDDPITYAFGLLITRVGDLNSADLKILAAVAKEAISGESTDPRSFTNILESQLKAKGKTDAEIDTALASFRDSILHNTNTEEINGSNLSLNLAGFTKLYKDAVDNSSDATKALGIAGGMMAKVFIAAGNDAGISLGDINYGLSSANLVAQEYMTEIMQNPNPETMGGFNPQILIPVMATFQAFQQTLDSYTTRAAYQDALKTFTAGSAIGSQFSGAMQTFTQTQSKIDVKYSPYFLSGSMNDATMAQMQQEYQDAFAAMMKDLESTGTIKQDTNDSLTLGIEKLLTLESGFTLKDINDTENQSHIINTSIISMALWPQMYPDGSEGNISILQATMMDEIGTWLGNYGELTYTPLSASDVNEAEITAFQCSQMCGNDAGCVTQCETNMAFNPDVNSTTPMQLPSGGEMTPVQGYAWTFYHDISKTTYPQKVLNAMQAFLLIQKDVQLASLKQWCLGMGECGVQTASGCTGDMQTCQQAWVTYSQKNFNELLDKVKSNISGYSKCQAEGASGNCQFTVDEETPTGITPLTAAQQKALVQLMMMPH